MDSLECRFPAHANHGQLLWLSAADKNKYGTKVTWNALFVPKSFCFWSLMAPGIVYGPLHYFRPNCPIRNVLRRLSHFLGTPPKSEGKVPGTSSRLPVFTGIDGITTSCLLPTRFPHPSCSINVRRLEKFFNAISVFYSRQQTRSRVSKIAGPGGPP